MSQQKDKIKDTENKKNSNEKTNSKETKSKKTDNDKAKAKKLTTRSSIRLLSIKCYDEQMPEGWEAVQQKIKSVDKTKIEIVSIKHYKDTNKDNIWEPSAEKVHYQFSVRCLDNPYHISTILNMLGIKFRKGKDEDIWNHHGVEVLKQPYAHMVTYLTHETDQAISDGKEKYDISEYVSNLTTDEILSIREGYFNTKKVDMVSVDELDREAYKIGYELGDFDKWYRTLSFTIRNSYCINTLEKSYHQGVEARVSEDDNLNRLCVFIQGKGNVGKTYATKKTLADKRTLVIKGGKTGMFDRLRESTEAVIIDDYKAENIINMSDNCFCDSYRRGSNNHYWCGKYFVVTSNLTFRKWAESCGQKTTQWINGEQVDADDYAPLKSRFYMCHIENIDGVNQLVCDSPSTRGTVADQLEKKEMFIKFRNTFNSVMSQYVPETETVEYTDILGTGKPVTNSMIDESKAEPEKPQKNSEPEEPKIDEEPIVEYREAEPVLSAEIEEEEPEDYDLEAELAKAEAEMQQVLKEREAYQKTMESKEPRPKTRRDTIPEGFDFYKLFG